MALLNHQDFENLPQTPALRWLMLRDLLEKRYDAEAGFENGMALQDAQLEYAHVLSDAADELELFELVTPAPANISAEFPVFKAEVAALAARLSLRSENSSQLVLSEPVRQRLHEEVERLRSAIGNEDLNDKKRAKLLNLLNQLDSEIDQDRFDYTKFWTALVLVSGMVASSTAFLAAAPDAVTTIAQVLGLQQDAQDRSEKPVFLPSDPPVPQLPPPPKLIEGPK